MDERITLPPDFKRKVLDALSHNSDNVKALLNIEPSLLIKLIECHLGQATLTISAEQMLKIIKHRPDDRPLINEMEKEATRLMELISLRDRFYQLREEQLSQKTSAVA